MIDAIHIAQAWIPDALGNECERKSQRPTIKTFESNL
jgi:hypothetical protein